MSTPADPLPGWLAEAIAAGGGFISVHDYMALCLYHPQHGYYTRGLNFLPEEGREDEPFYGRDFTTAPLLTPLFGAALARWVAQTWQALGAPARIVLAEAGPGNGALMHNILNHLPQNIRLACEPLLIETSPVLTALQQQKLAGENARWATLLEAQAHPLIVVANELLDAFPIHAYEYQSGAWVEHGFDANLAPTTRPAEAPPEVAAQVEGQVIEVSPGADMWLGNLRKIADAALLCDYGASGETAVRRRLSTQAVYRHQKVPFTHLPGQTDLTAHVNFAHVAGTLGGAPKLTDLAEFLLQYKILDEAGPTISQPETAAALHRLLHPSQMGALFKVLEFRAK